MTQPVFAFDLDDTLYFERDYSLSALRHVGAEVAKRFGLGDAAARLTALFQSGEADAIGRFWAENDLPEPVKADCIAAMRAHVPDISLRPDAKVFLQRLRQVDRPFGIVTDGRPVTQRAKIGALGLSRAFAISISGETGFEKPAAGAFAPILDYAQGRDVIFVGDNPAKDFLYPNAAGWTSVMVRSNGVHIHSQALPEDRAYHPQVVIESFAELERWAQG